jgi:hypothetical protein
MAGRHCTVRAAIGSHIWVVTMGTDLTTVDGHINAIRRWRDGATPHSIVSFAAVQ